MLNKQQANNYIVLLCLLYCTYHFYNKKKQNKKDMFLCPVSHHNGKTQTIDRMLSVTSQTYNTTVPFNCGLLPEVSVTYGQLRSGSI